MSKECKHEHRVVQTIHKPDGDYSGWTICNQCGISLDELNIQNLAMKNDFRTFESGATRDIWDKLEYKDYIHPLCDFSFAQYMQSKQYIGGKKRAGDNRQKWIPPESLLDSLTRHMEILKLLEKGYSVTEYKKDGKVFVTIDSCGIPDGAMNIDKKNLIGELNAIRFNSEALKLHYLQQEIIKQNCTFDLAQDNSEKTALMAPI